jgi:hypothetical protein
MKALILISAVFSSHFSILLAKEINPFEDRYIVKLNEEYKEAAFNQEMKVSYLTRLLEHQQKSYDDKITYLENELHKTKERLIEKSLNQEKIEDAMKEKFNAETVALKRELAYKTKSVLEYQRQIEKMKPSEDLKNIIKLNTDLAAELRKSEDQIAIFQLNQAEGIRGDRSASRLPASVQKDK